MLGLILSLALLQSQAPAGGVAPTVAAPATAVAATPPTTATPAPAAADTTKATPPATGAAAPAPVNPLIQFLPILPVVVLFYFMMYRPQKQEEKKRKEQLGRMQRNDKVITAGGMYATVVNVDPDSDTVTLRLGSEPGVKVEFTRASVVRILSASDKKEAG